MSTILSLITLLKIIKLPTGLTKELKCWKLDLPAYFSCSDCRRRRQEYQMNKILKRNGVPIMNLVTPMNRWTLKDESTCMSFSLKAFMEHYTHLSLTNFSSFMVYRNFTTGTVPFFLSTWMTLIRIQTELQLRFTSNQQFFHWGSTFIFGCWMSLRMAAKLSLAPIGDMTELTNKQRQIIDEQVSGRPFKDEMRIMKIKYCLNVLIFDRNAPDREA